MRILTLTFAAALAAGTAGTAEADCYQNLIQGTVAQDHATAVVGCNIAYITLNEYYGAPFTTVQWVTNGTAGNISVWQRDPNGNVSLIPGPSSHDASGSIAGFLTYSYIVTAQEMTIGGNLGAIVGPCDPDNFCSQAQASTYP